MGSEAVGHCRVNRDHRLRLLNHVGDLHLSVHDQVREASLIGKIENFV